MMSQSKCVVCGRKITYRFTLCRICEKEYGKRKADWPPWLVYLAQEQWKTRKRQQRNPDRELPFSDFSSDFIENISHIDDKDKDRFM